MIKICTTVGCTIVSIAFIANKLGLQIAGGKSKRRRVKQRKTRKLRRS